MLATFTAVLLFIFMESPNIAYPATMTDGLHIASDQNIYIISESIQLYINKISEQEGLPNKIDLPFQIKESQDYELYFMATTLLNRTQHLVEEINKVPFAPEQLILDRVQLKDIIDILHKSLTNFDSIKNGYEIKNNLRYQATGAENNTDILQIDFNDLFVKTYNQSYILEKIIKFDASPDDVFIELELALYYIDKLLNRFPGITKRVPQTDFNKATPNHVYEVILRCFPIIKSMAYTMKFVDHSTITKNEEYFSDITAQDVLDLATLLKGELFFFYSRISDRVEIAHPSASTVSGKSPQDNYEISLKIEAYLRLLLNSLRDNIGIL